MTPQEYIDSGLLEGYVLGALSAAEAAEVARAAAQYPAVRDEIEAIEAALKGYAQVGASLPAAVRERTLAAAFGEEPTAPARSPAPYLATAAVLLLMLSLGFNVYHYYLYQLTERRLEAVQERAAQQEAQLATAQEEAATLTALRAPALRVAQLAGTDQAPDARVTVFWNPETQQVYLNLNALSPPPAGQQYQLWALRDGQPADAGVIDHERPTMQSMKATAAADAFAITLEKEGGSPEPNLEALRASGPVGG